MVIIYYSKSTDSTVKLLIVQCCNTALKLIVPNLLRNLSLYYMHSQEDGITVQVDDCNYVCEVIEMVQYFL